MRRRFLYAYAFVLVAGLAACDGEVVVHIADDGIDGSGTIVSEARTVAGFDQITLAGEGTVIVTTGHDPSLTIETDDNLLSHIETTVRNGVLEIATEPGTNIDPSDSVVYRVAATDITGLTLTGAGSFRLGECETEAFSVVLAGAGDVEIERLVADNLDVDIPGVGSVTVAGKVVSQEVNLPGAGDYRGENLESSEATVTASGVGSATVWVTTDLEATVSGVGSIDYFGSPHVTQSVSGIGAVTSRGDPAP
jgi:hypothetical protein